MLGDVWSKVSMVFHEFTEFKSTCPLRSNEVNTEANHRRFLRSPLQLRLMWGLACVVNNAIHVIALLSANSRCSRWGWWTVRLQLMSTTISDVVYRHHRLIQRLGVSR